jgi:type IV pilus assembly protein PilO
MTLDDLSKLDFQDLGGWPLPVKLVAIVLVIVVILFAGFKTDIEQLRATIEQEKSKEVELLASLDKKQKKAANLEALKVQMQEMQQSFGDMLRQLPNKTEVAGLLVDISQTGLASGLEFQLFKPGKEVPSEFYAELPIQISVIGNYHQFGEFISGVAALPRIVTSHNVNITKKAAKKGEPETMVMTATAKTYRALDEEEFEKEEKAKQQAKKGGRKR